MEMNDLTVLAVEDNKQAMGLLKAMLADIGVRQVYTAKTGKEALSFMDSCEEMIDVILCDWNMPEMTGFELLRQVRAVNPDLPFLMITGASDKESVVRAKESGVTGYIVKPYSRMQLEKKLQLMLRVMRAKNPADEQGAVWERSV